MSPSVLKQRNREYKKASLQRAWERAAATAEALARQAEQYAEAMAPSVVRNAVMSHDGTMLRGALVTIENGMPVRSSIVDSVKTLKRNPLITDKMIDACRMLQCDWADVSTGINATAVQYGERTSGGSGDGDGRHMGILMQIRAEKRLRGALTALGVHCDAILRVVVESVPVSVLAEEMGWETDVGLAWVVDGLKKMVRFYCPDRESASSITSAQIAA